MSCGTNRCALRRFDGHGSSSYRPSNQEATKSFNLSVQAMLAERARQDSGIFTPLSVQPSLPIPTTTVLSKSETSKLKDETIVYYSLSDSKPSSHS